MRTEHLVDRLGGASVVAPGPDHVSIQPMTILRDTRMALFQHPDSLVEFAPFVLGARPRLLVACGIKKVAWTRMRSEIRFEVSVHVDGEGETPVLSVRLDPRLRGEDRCWVERDVDLARFAGRRARLIFRTSVPPRGDARYAWAGWAEPRVTHEAPAPPRPARLAPEAPLVLLVTADALRADYLGCAGHPGVRTPHLDALAKAGVRMLHARAQTGTSIGSYASLLTGQHVPTHGIDAEWGRVPPSLPTLPVYLRAFGYHTLLAASDTELGEREAGVGDLFCEQIPCLARPGQDGAITTRHWMDWLERRPAKPAFVWLEYFDTHPPATPPEPFRSMYYSGDPTRAARAHRSADVARIRGIEAVQEIEQALPALRRGRPDVAITEKLRATVALWRGAPGSGPDLAAHLQALPAAARRGLTVPQLGDWLARELEVMDRGETSRELVDWLERLLPMLKEIEADITAWLEGVVDFRYPISQYMAGVSYLDHHVGRLVEALEERGLAERSTVIVCAPHGEVLGERGVYFHHHTLMEASLRVPLIWKAPAGVLRYPGAEIGGVYDLIDVFPTLMDALGLPVPAGLAGVSRWPVMRDGLDIAPHPSVAVNNHGSMLSVAVPPWKLLTAYRDHRVSDDWVWRAGDRALYDLRELSADTTDVAARNPDVVMELAARLDQWRRAMGLLGPLQ
ncbi:MAG TPA: sulfatase-like hydrolase/transferase [Methylomirabilota bacterium]|nr:sulfatase-like hydrolase/transferase [Methylomirabilota bacterium]